MLLTNLFTKNNFAFFLVTACFSSFGTETDSSRSSHFETGSNSTTDRRFTPEERHEIYGQYGSTPRLKEFISRSFLVTGGTLPPLPPLAPPPKRIIATPPSLSPVTLPPDILPEPPPMVACHRLFTHGHRITLINEQHVYRPCLVEACCSILSCSIGC